MAAGLVLAERSFLAPSLLISPRARMLSRIGILGKWVFAAHIAENPLGYKG
jgi:hypothetical protein